MELRIEQPCPSCGAAIVINEDDRLVRCEFCDVLNYRVRQKLPRYILPPKLPRHIAEDGLLYIPYLRFKGCIYTVEGLEVVHRLIDTTRVGCDVGSVPVSLGLRPQAMKVVPITENLPGRFVRQTVQSARIFEEAVKLSALFREERKASVHHRAFIGESVSRVYLPVYSYSGMLYDGVSHQKIGPDAVAEQLAGDLVGFQGEWEPRFIATVCPHCGDVMDGDRESLVLACSTCGKHWLEEDGRLVGLDYHGLKALDSQDSYIPFWQIEAEEESGKLATLADFYELTNQPVVIQRQHRQTPLIFYLPAFKMNPAIFLQIAKMLTVGQWLAAGCQQIEMSSHPIYPVTLPHQEAAEALRTIVAGSAVSLRRVVEVLPALKFCRYRKRLVYLPFRNAGHDMIEQYSGICISRAALRFGRQL